jgi:nucleotide-sensitive chloride channel 1A
MTAAAPCFSLDACRMCVDDASWGPGRLVVSEEAVSWAGPEKSLRIDYPSLMLHAVCTDPEAFPEPCVYCQLEDGREVRLVMAVDLVHQAFAELSRCTALHPDAAGGEEDEAGEMFGEAGGEMDAMLQRLDGLVQEPAGQFEDPEE